MGMDCLRLNSPLSFLTRTHPPSFKPSINMFSKLTLAAVASVLFTLAAAIPTTVPITPPTSDQCCGSVVDSSSTSAGAVLATLGIDLGGINVPVGLSCSPITVLGNNWLVVPLLLGNLYSPTLTGPFCSGGVTTRCDAPEIEWGGLIAINCIPITA
ncbi:hydrophobin 2 [Mycena filopes]|nr:hydrophobin 2 [Mycena filopes]